jgi:hypothetical protein
MSKRARDGFLAFASAKIQGALMSETNGCNSESSFADGPPTDLPDLQGKVIALYPRGMFPMGPVVLDDCAFETQGGRRFLVGMSRACRPDAQEWTTGSRRWIAWDAVDQYFLFESLEEYYARISINSSLRGQHEGAFGSSAGFNGTGLGPECMPVEPSGIPIGPNTRLEVGSPVLANWRGAWWRAQVIGFDQADQVRIHYIGWGDAWDETVQPNVLQVDISESLRNEE